ncbi:unnamed protein product [Phyllotreta striolata]|uniref:Uncharacterized protein n=1 Tax=Phyllotreta striolata TaxID=444603 RepID=A0A9N9XQ95_PHYSR|nr:unnamed protein product [Phyllotreta striolata]
MNNQTQLYQCRLCLTRTSTRVNIFGGDFPKMLEILTSIKVKESDGLPKFSCTKCAKDVQLALTVKKRIIKAHKILVDALNTKKQLLEKSKKTSNDKIVKKTLKNNVKKPTTKQQNVVMPLPIIESVESLAETSSNTSDLPIKQEPPEASSDSAELPANSTEDLQQVIARVQKRLRPTSFTCETCNETFTEKSAYSLHCMKHKKTECHVCGRIIRSDNFKKHLMLHTAGPSVCSLCGATCKNIESLRGHIFYQHKNAAEQYVCELCGKGFRIKYKFILHKKKEHLNVRNFKCDVCGKCFFTNGDLRSHAKMTHQKLRPHVCEYCGTGFSSSYALKTHKRQHTNEKPFVCEYCNEGFRQRVSLKSHLKSKHGIEEAKAWFCKVCERGFATNYALSIHERLHEVRKCHVCSESFGSSEFLNNHLWEVHNVKEDNAEFKCDHCSVGFASEELLNAHVLDMHEKNDDLATDSMQI